MVAAPGPGGGPNVRILDGKTGEQIPGPLGSFWAYTPTFAGGVHVAVAYLDGDGVPDVVTAAGEGGGPHVRAFSGATGEPLADFFAFDPDFLGGVTVAAADLNGDGRAEVAVGAGAGGGPRVRVYDPLAGTPVDGPLGSFFAFDPGQRGGVHVGTDSMAGDLDGDGVADLAVGTGPGTDPRVRVFSGATGAVLREVTPFGAPEADGVRPALAYVNDDPFADVVAGSGPGGSGLVRVFDGKTGAQLPPPQGEYAPFGAGAVGGVWVAASNDPIMPGVSTPTAYPWTPTSYTSFTVHGEVYSSQNPVVNTPTGTVTFKVMNYATYQITTLGTAALTYIQTGRAAADFTYSIGLIAGTYALYFEYSGDAVFSSRLSALGGMTVLDPKIEITPAAGGKLKVAKWEDAFVMAADGKSVEVKGPNPDPDPNGKANWDFIDRDPDRFNVWVFDIGSWQRGANEPAFKYIEATVKTENHAGFESYDDNATPVSLVRYTGAGREDGWYWSDSQLLVSNIKDDEYSSPQYLQDDNKDPGGDGLLKHATKWKVSDRTHTVALRGSVIAKYTTVTGKSITDTELVPHKYAVGVYATALKIGGVAVVDEAYSNQKINKANEQLAQVGILLIPTGYQAKNQPDGLDLSKGGLDASRNPNNMQQVHTEEEISLLTTPGMRSETDRDIDLFWVNYISTGPFITDLAKGIAYTVSSAPRDPGDPVKPDLRYADAIAISKDLFTFFTVAHEIVHILTDAGHYGTEYGPEPLYPWPTNIMRLVPHDYDDSVKFSKRLTPGQELAIVGAPPPVPAKRPNLLIPP